MQYPDITSGFQQVTQTTGEQFFVKFLERTDTLPFVQAAQSHMRARLHLKKGQRLLDVGCGLGQESHRIAQWLAPGGSVVGIDKSEALVAVARQRAQSADLPLTFQVGDALALDFADHSFDRCRAERMLMFLTNPRQPIGGDGARAPSRWPHRAL